MEGEPSRRGEGLGEVLADRDPPRVGTGTANYAEAREKHQHQKREQEKLDSQHGFICSVVVLLLLLFPLSYAVFTIGGR